MIQINNFLINDAKKYLLPLFLLIIFLFSVGLIYIYNFCEDDYLQGNIVNIIYLHVPSAWLAMLIYCLMALFSFIHIIFYNQYASIYAFALSYIGLLFCFICFL